MKRIRFDHAIIIVLVLLSVVFFILQQLLFHNIVESEFLIFQDLIFLPLEVVIITFFLDRILSAREKRERLEQINIVIAAFFSETGSGALRSLNAVISDINAVKALVDMKPTWNDKAFESAARAVKNCPVQFTLDSKSLSALKEALPEKNIIIQLFANPNLLEHDTFTNMLWALYHLVDEITSRTDLTALPKADFEHLKGDIARAYNLLAYEWVIYMKHLKARYPYLWSLAIRKNPFSEQPSVIVQAS